MKLSLIAAIASGNRALGKDNKLIYRIHEDLQRFRQLTSGHPIIMGRKTFESIGRPLLNRTNIIVTRNPSLKRRRLSWLNCIIARSLEKAIELAKKSEGNDEIFIIGGGQIYQEAIEIGRAHV